MQFTTAPEYETVIKSIILHIVDSTKISNLKSNKYGEIFGKENIVEHTRWINNLILCLLVNENISN